jgi:hypothetical protein
MKKWERMGCVFKAENQESWMQSHSQVPCPILLEDRIRVFFATRKKIDESDHFESNTGFFDLDRKDLTRVINISERPVINLGNKGTFSRHGISPSHVIFEEEKINLYYGGWSRQSGTPYEIAIGLASSNDNGLSFEKFGDDPIINRSLHEPFGVNSVWVDHYEDEWRMLYSGVLAWSNLGTPKPSAKYLLFCASSTDGKKWYRSGDAILPSNPDDCQCVPTVITCGGINHLWYSHRKGADYRRALGGYTISYATSEDFSKWKPSDRLSFTHSEKGFDSQMVCYPAVIQVDGVLFLFYCGNDFGKEGIGIARLVDSEIL